jgi:hypothetical protein
MEDRYITNVCTKALYIDAFDILNIPSLASLDAEHWAPSIPGGKNASISSYAIGSAFTLLESFEYELNISLPLSKPIAVQCPITACIFPISGYFTFLQRLFFPTISLSLALQSNSPFCGALFKSSLRISGSASS